ncbi:hypothetical protein EDB85DRAFT_1901766 [Lactarius pseudohatsudake]|nr:hypothetical protein EDB85DRAFT_1901766 [Lactarius pseudohatsudake]
MFGLHRIVLVWLSCHTGLIPTNDIQHPNRATSPSSAHRFLPRFPHPIPSHLSTCNLSLSLQASSIHYLAQDDNEAHFHLTNIDRPRVPASRAVSVRHTRIGGNVAHLRFSPSPHVYLAVASPRVAQQGRRRVALDTTILVVIIQSRQSHVYAAASETLSDLFDPFDERSQRPRRPGDDDEATTTTTTTMGYDYDHTDKATTTTMATRRPQRGDHGDGDCNGRLRQGDYDGDGVTTTRWCDYDETTAATATATTMTME